MASQQFSISYKKNEGTIMSPSELKELYFHGIPVADQEGNPIPDSQLTATIKKAQREVENFLNLRFMKQCVEDEQNFVLRDFKEWALIVTTFPCKVAISLDGYINTTQQVQYPKNWLSTKISPDGNWERRLNLIPNTGTIETNSVVYLGISPHLGFYSNDYIPDYWQIRYITGFDELPEDLVDMVGKLASINIFHILGDLILGAGIANISLGIDGLSQSIGTTSSATNSGYGARIVGYLKDLDQAKKIAKSTYDGLKTMSL